MAPADGTWDAMELQILLDPRPVEPCFPPTKAQDSVHRLKRHLALQPPSLDVAIEHLQKLSHTAAGLRCLAFGGGVAMAGVRLRLPCRLQPLWSGR